MTIGKLGKKADETANEQVITGASATVLVEDHLTKEQEKRELISCGRLRRDAPGADDEEKDTINSILDSVKMSKGGGSISPARKHSSSSRTARRTRRNQRAADRKGASRRRSEGSAMSSLDG